MTYGTLTQALIGADYLEREGHTTCEAVREVVEELRRLQNPSPLQTIRNIIRDHRTTIGRSVEEIGVSPTFYSRLCDELDELRHERHEPPGSNWSTLRIEGVLITRIPTEHEDARRHITDALLDPLNYVGFDRARTRPAINQP